MVDGLIGLATMATLARAASRDRRTAVVAGMLGACFPDSDKPSTLFFGRSPFPVWVDEVHKRIQNEAEERMPYEAFGGLVGAGDAYLAAPSSLGLPGNAPVRRSVLLSVVPASSPTTGQDPEAGLFGPTVFRVVSSVTFF